MAVQFRATCSDCGYMFDLHLGLEDENIVCPRCGHYAPTFSESELHEIDHRQRKQHSAAVIGMAVLLIGLAALVWWCFRQDSLEAVKEAPGKVATGWGGTPEREPDTLHTVLLVVTALCTVVAMVFTVLANRVRYICEF